MKGIRALPVLTTSRLRLRPMRANDLEAVHRLRSDPETADLLGISPPKSKRDTAAYIQSIENGVDLGEWMLWALTPKAERSDAFIGSIVLWNYKPERNSAELGYSLLPERRGQGYMQEAASQVARYAFRTLSLDLLCAFTATHNLRSQRLLERCGFKQVGRMNSESLRGEMMLLAAYERPATQKDAENPESIGSDATKAEQQGEEA